MYMASRCLRPYGSFCTQLMIHSGWNKVADILTTDSKEIVCISKHTLLWHHNEHDGVSNHQPHDCLSNRSFGRKYKTNMKAPRHWPVTGEFPSQKASNAKNISIWWLHHVSPGFVLRYTYKGPIKLSDILHTKSWNVVWIFFHFDSNFA